MPDPVAGADVLFSTQTSRMPSVPEDKLYEPKSTANDILLKNPMTLVPESVRQKTQDEIEKVRGKSLEIDSTRMQTLKDAAAEMSVARQKTASELSQLTQPAGISDPPKPGHFESNILPQMAIFALTAALGGMGTRQPLLNAMNAMGMAIKGYREGNDKNFQNKIAEWKLHTQIATEKWKEFRDKRDSIIKAADSTAEQKAADLKLLDTQFGLIDKSLDRESKTLEDRLSAYDKQDQHFYQLENSVQIANLHADQARERLLDARNRSSEMLGFREDMAADRQKRSDERAQAKLTTDMGRTYAQRVKEYKSKIDLADQIMAEITPVLAAKTRTEGGLVKFKEGELSSEASSLIRNKLAQYLSANRQTNFQLKRMDSESGSLVERHLNDIDFYLTGALTYSRVNKIATLLTNQRDFFVDKKMKPIWSDIKRQAQASEIDPRDVYGSDPSQYAGESDE